MIFRCRRWAHNVGGSISCYNGTHFNANYCPDPLSCAQNCALEGVDYDLFDISTSGSSASLVYKSASAVGSRVYVMKVHKYVCMFYRHHFVNASIHN